MQMFLRTGQVYNFRKKEWEGREEGSKTQMRKEMWTFPEGWQKVTSSQWLTQV